MRVSFACAYKFKLFIGFVSSVLVLIGAGAIVGGPYAHAHASLIGSEPAYGEGFEAAPTQVRFVFDNPVEPGLMRVRLKELDSETELGVGELVGDRMPRTEVLFDLPEHSEGRWSVVWTSFAFDGHIVSGTLPYTVGEVEPIFMGGGGPLLVSESGPPGEIVEIQLRFLSYISLSAVLGALLLLWLGRGLSPGISLIRKQAGSIVVGASFAAATFVAARFALLVWRLNKVDGLDQVPRLLIEGQMTVWPVAFMLLIAVAAIGKQRPLWGLGLVSGAIVLLPSAGHVSTYASPASGALLAGAHLLAAAVWAGGVGVFAYAITAEEWPAIENKWSDVRPLLNKLSSLWVFSFVVLALTGARAGWVFTGGEPAGRYSTFLVLKLVGVACLVLIGGFNAVLRRKGKDLNAYMLLGEGFLFVVILVVSSVLATTSPSY